MNNIIVLMLIAILTTGCSMFKSRVQIVAIEKRVEPIEILHPPLPDPMVWEEVEWKVLTVERMRDIIQMVDSGEISERDAVFFAVSPEGYENLSVNMAEIKRLIEGHKAVIIYYKTTVPDTIFIPSE